MKNNSYSNTRTGSEHDKRPQNISGKEFCYLERRLDVGSDILKLTAIISMTIDHLGVVLYPEYIFLRIIGRLAFPIFCYLLVLGVERTRNVRHYLTRLLVFALISQVPFYLAAGYQPLESLNVYFTLSFGVMFLMDPLLILVPLFVSFFINFDYSLYGIVLIVCMRTLRENTKEGVVLLVLLNVFSLLLSDIQIFSLFALPIILLHKSGYLRLEKKINGNTVYPSWRKYLFYAYYPVHLTMLYLIKLFYF